MQKIKDTLSQWRTCEACKMSNANGLVLHMQIHQRQVRRGNGGHCLSPTHGHMSRQWRIHQKRINVNDGVHPKCPPHVFCLAGCHPSHGRQANGCLTAPNKQLSLHDFFCETTFATSTHKMFCHLPDVLPTCVVLQAIWSLTKLFGVARLETSQMRFTIWIGMQSTDSFFCWFVFLSVRHNSASFLLREKQQKHCHCVHILESASLAVHPFGCIWCQPSSLMSDGVHFNCLQQFGKLSTNLTKNEDNTNCKCLSLRHQVHRTNWRDRWAWAPASSFACRFIASCQSPCKNWQACKDAVNEKTHEGDKHVFHLKQAWLPHAALSSHFIPVAASLASKTPAHSQLSVKRSCKCTKSWPWVVWEDWMGLVNLIAGSKGCHSGFRQSHFVTHWGANWRISC